MRARRKHVEAEATVSKQRREEIAALQAELAQSDGGVDEDPGTGRWFIVVRLRGARARPPVGARQAQSLIALASAGTSLALGARDSHRVVKDAPKPAGARLSGSIKPLGSARCKTVLDEYARARPLIAPRP